MKNYREFIYKNINLIKIFERFDNYRMMLNTYLPRKPIKIKTKYILNIKRFKIIYFQIFVYKYNK
ncbi:hypothetical protein pb186bvf_000939 [Paramecium bursaria]